MWGFTFSSFALSLSYLFNVEIVLVLFSLSENCKCILLFIKKSVNAYLVVTILDSSYFLDYTSLYFPLYFSVDRITFSSSYFTPLLPDGWNLGCFVLGTSFPHSRTCGDPFTVKAAYDHANQSCSVLGVMVDEAHCEIDVIPAILEKGGTSRRGLNLPWTAPNMTCFSPITFYSSV